MFYPCEGVFAVGEVKSTIGTKEAKDVIRKIASVRRLSRFARPDARGICFRPYGSRIPTGPEALSIAGDAATGLKAIVPNPDLTSALSEEFLANFKARYGVVASLPWFQGSAYDDVYIAAECLRQTNDDQDADGFRDCLYSLTRSGAIGDNYSFDENGDVVGLSNVVVEVLPTAERTEGNLGYRVLGPAPTP